MIEARRHWWIPRPIVASDSSMEHRLSLGKHVGYHASFDFVPSFATEGFC